ncbi:cell wall protein IFF6-like [Salvia hispanica]|uniref:cell wall protein IFF6-like n=1 Tax=Salvia hispanica TaxID=49212 RepID=UPI002009386D|nr:cell wall protein IFF6-like [Salvia hispanica]
MAKRKATIDRASTTGGASSEPQPAAESRPPSPQRSQPPPTTQIPAMVPLEALAAFLSQQDPNRDWTATLAGFGLTGGIPATSNPTPTTTTEQPPTTTPKTSTLTSENISTKIAAQSEPSPTYQQTEPLDVSPLSAYQDPNWGETEDKESGVRASESKKGEAREIRATEAKIDAAEEEIDLNETARKQGLMTGEEFQAVLGKGDRIVVNPEGVAEVMDLASQSVGKGEATKKAESSEEVAHQSVEEKTDEQPKRAEHIEEERQEPEAHQEEASVVTKPKPIKRRLVLKNDPKAERQKPQRVSQRCLGKWTSNKAGANTAADAVEVSSDDERTTPTKPKEEPSNASQEDTQLATGTVSATPTDQEKNTDKVAEGLDLASESVGREEATRSDTSARMVAEPTAQEDTSTRADEEGETMDVEETKYIQERKR